MIWNRKPKGQWMGGFTPWGCPCSVYVVKGKIKKAKCGFGSNLDPKICTINLTPKKAST